MPRSDRQARGRWAWVTSIGRPAVVPGSDYRRPMSNLDTHPTEEVCAAGLAGVEGAVGGIEILDHRDVPLGGTRAMSVRRTIPQRARSFVGAWCFCDHYGPDDVGGTPGMQVPPHPHTGLQTVTWLFAGKVLHRDSVGSLQLVRPGELNLMTAGRGISHSEETPAGLRAPVLHGVQLWVALPADRLDDAPAFEHHGDLPVLETDGVRVQVFVGGLRVAGAELRSPATTFTPLVGAQLDLAPGATLVLDVDPGFEHGLLVDDGEVLLEGVEVPPSSLGYATPRSTLTVTAGPGGPARAILIGGEPFGEDIVMWWNFVGRSHDDVMMARDDWQAQLVVTGDRGPNHGGTQYAPGVAEGRFGEVVGYTGGPLPAPALPDVRLRPRVRRG